MYSIFRSFTKEASEDFFTLGESRHWKKKLREKKIEKHHIVILGAGLFVVTLHLVGERFAWAVIIARCLDSIGDILFERAIPRFDEE